MSVERETSYLHYKCDKCKFTYTTIESSEELIMGPRYSESSGCKPKYW